MADTIQVVQGDTLPAASTTLTIAGVAADIENATVKFQMIDGTGATQLDAAANNDQVGDGSDGTKGMVSYDWATGETDEAGWFRAKWEVTYADGKQRSFPTTNHQPVLIRGWPL